MICLVKLNHIQLGKENSRTCLKPPPSYHTTSMYVPGPSVLFAKDQVGRNGPTDLSSPSLFHKVGSPLSFLCQLRTFQKLVLLWKFSLEKLGPPHLSAQKTTSRLESPRTTPRIFIGRNVLAVCFAKDVCLISERLE